MACPKTVVLIGTLDSKGEELLYLKRLVETRGHRALVVDVGVRGCPAFLAEVSREEVAAAAGADLADLAAADERGRALTAMMNGAALLVRELQATGRLDGILGLGGGSGTAVAAGAMRALPFGVPTSWPRPTARALSVPPAWSACPWRRPSWA